METHESFNYALFDTDETALLGCVYIDPPEKPGADAEISWWVVDECVGTELEAALDELVPRWIAEDWPLRPPALRRPRPVVGGVAGAAGPAGLTTSKVSAPSQPALRASTGSRRRLEDMSDGQYPPAARQPRLPQPASHPLRLDPGPSRQPRRRRRRADGVRAWLPRSSPPRSSWVAAPVWGARRSGTPRTTSQSGTPSASAAPTTSTVANQTQSPPPTARSSRWRRRCCRAW